MNLESKIDAWKKGVDDVKWDPVTQRRVLTKLLSSRQAPKMSLMPRRRILGLAAVVMSVVCIVVGASLLNFDDITSNSETAVQSVSSNIGQENSGAALSQMGFIDGSTATYLSPADVDVDVQTPTSMRLWHHFGRVRYEVKKLPSRSFVVSANGIDVTVTGTVFVVDVDEVDVKVKVERGAVIVDSGSGIIELRAGEEISLACHGQPTGDGDSDELDVLAGEGSEDTNMEKGGNGDRVLSFSYLMREVDRTRNSGDLVQAQLMLQKLITYYPGDRRIVSVFYTLGKVESRRGRHMQAARAFRKCWRSSPGGTLAEDALFQEAISWERMGKLGEATEAAKRYLQKFQGGPYVDRMRKIAQ